MKRMLILSGKGGTGKTTTAAAFVHFSHACAVADCDVDAPNLHLVNPPSTEPETNVFYGGDKASVDPAKCVGCGKCVAACRFDALQLSQGKCLVDEYSCEGCGVCAYVCPEQAVALHPDAAGIRELYLGEQVFSTAALKMGRGNSGKLVSEVKLAMLKHAPKESLAIIDGSPGIGCPVIASISGVDLVMVVAEPSLSGISDLKRLVRTASTLQTRLAVCVNKWDTDPHCTGLIEDYCREQQLPFLGRIPYDPAVVAAVNGGYSVAQVDCPAARALEQIYRSASSLLAESNT